MFDPAGPVLLISALKRERPPARADWRTIAGGVGRVRSEAATADGIGRLKPRLVVSIGYCGGLDPKLRVGDVVTADAVLAPDGVRYAAEPLGEPAVTLATADRVLPTAAGKAALREAAGAAVVEMEAAGVAAACEAADVPFAAVKVVTDAAADDLPRGVAPFFDLNRHAFTWRTPLRCWWAVSKRPALVGDLRRLARTSRRCSKSLAAYLDAALTPPTRPDTEG